MNTPIRVSGDNRYTTTNIPDQQTFVYGVHATPRVTPPAFPPEPSTTELLQRIIDLETKVAALEAQLRDKQL